MSCPDFAENIEIIDGFVRFHNDEHASKQGCLLRVRAGVGPASRKRDLPGQFQRNSGLVLLENADWFKMRLTQKEIILLAP